MNWLAHFIRYTYSGTIGPMGLYRVGVRSTSQILLSGVKTISPDAETITTPAPTDSGDHDKFAHYVRKNQITESAVTGKAVIALCGKKWVPTRKPDEFPVCPDCKRIYDRLRPGGS